MQVLESAALFAAELDPHVGPAHHLALEGGAVGDGNRHVGDLDLDAAHLDGLLYHFGRFFGVVFGLDLVPGHRDDVFVAGDAGGQNLGDDGVGDGGKAVGDGSGSGGVFQIVHLAQRQDESKDAELVVEHDLAPLARLESAKGQGGAGGKSQRIDGGDGVPPKGDDVGIVPHFYPFLLQLVNDGTPVDVAAEEDEDVALL